MIPVTFALMTTTKGHFDIKTRWRETIESFGKDNGINFFEEKVAHIKITPGDEELASEMANELISKGFLVLTTQGQWKHGDTSHQENYLQDIYKVSNFCKTPYIFIVEDDWKIKFNEFTNKYWYARAYYLLSDNPDLMQVRIARYTNEYERINNLKKKHNLDRSASEVDEEFFLHNDYSANPSFYRTRDIRNAVALTLRTNLPKHVEHGVGEILRLLGEPGKQFACLNPDEIRIGHIGCLPGEEDDLTKPLNCD